MTFARVASAAALFLGLGLWLAALALGRPVGAEEGGWLAFGLCFGPMIAGALGLITAAAARAGPGGEDHGARSRGLRNRGAAAIALALAVVGFYLLKDLRPDLLEGPIRLLDPLARGLRGEGRSADRYFLYGFLYTLAVLVMGYRMLWRYRERYQAVRTLTACGVQLGFAFLLPSLLVALDRPELYVTYFWPLAPAELWPERVRWLLSRPGGALAFAWFTVAAFVLTPVLTWRFGKRWYCSWVCGCGALAETLGDPFRHLSSKRTRAWRVERWTVHGVLLGVAVVTALQWGGEVATPLAAAARGLSLVYGAVVVTVLAGWVGTGLYFVAGSRVWCRFFCPMAAVLGLVQRFWSRFRITTNGGQCMACGRCSTYCEMGIDVRSYAQRGANIVRASCVGCGICASLCPRGVLRLEDGASPRDRFPGADRPVSDLLGALGKGSPPSDRNEQ